MAVVLERLAVREVIAAFPGVRLNAEIKTSPLAPESLHVFDPETGRRL